MAEYYALLARAVGRLQPSTETARRDIYAKARNALIQQLKGITPPLSPGEISKQRLELEEAIRKIEREAAAPPLAAATEAEISRTAARAMEEALGPIADPVPTQRAAESARAAEPPRAAPQPARAPIVDAVRAAPEPVRAEPVTPRAPAPPTPAEVRSRAVAAEAADDDTFSVVAPTPIPLSQGQPRPAARPVPRPAAPPPRGTNWDERATASAFNDDTRAREGGRARRLSRAERRAEKRAERQRPQRSALSRLLLFVLILLVIGGAGYAAYAYRAELQDFFASLTDGSEPAADPAAVTVDAGGAAVPAGGATPGDVRIVGPQPADAGVGPPNAGAAPAVAEVIPTQAILYERVGDGDLPAFEGTITWAFAAEGPNGPRLDAVIRVPERGLTVQLSFEQAPETATLISHTIEVVVDVPADFPGGGIREVAQLAAKNSEDAIGTPIVATSQSLPPDYFLFELTAENVRQNMSQLRQDWFDLGFTYADGQQAIITFNKGTEGRAAMTAALAAWGD